MSENNLLSTCLLSLERLEAMYATVPDDDRIAEIALELEKLLCDGILLDAYQATHPKKGPLRLIAPELRCSHGKTELAIFALTGMFGSTPLDSAAFVMGTSSDQLPTPTTKLKISGKFPVSGLLKSTSICFRGHSITREDIVKYLSAKTAPASAEPTKKEGLLNEIAGMFTFTATGSKGNVAWKTPFVNVEGFCIGQNVMASVGVQALFQHLKSLGP